MRLSIQCRSRGFFLPIHDEGRAPGGSYQLSFFFCLLFIRCSFFAEEEGDNISVTLPPSQHGWTVVVTKASKNDHVLKDQPGVPSQPYPIPSTCASVNVLSNNDNTGSPAPSVEKTADLTGPIVDVGSISVGMETLSLSGRVGAHETALEADPPSHLRACSYQDQFHVSKDMLERYEPFSIGWKARCWVVVFRGRNIGVFYDFWYVHLIWFSCSSLI